MITTEPFELLDDLDDDEAVATFETIARPDGRRIVSEGASTRHRQAKHGRVASKRIAADASFIQTQDDSTRSFALTYRASRFEEGWLLNSIRPFHEQRWISDVLRQVKGGKEASVYLCRAGAQVPAALIAAKVYRPRNLRNLKNDQLYREGRETLDEDGNLIQDLGMLKAQHNRSMYGEQIRRQSWIAFEFQTLERLHAAGADVPKPYEMAPKAILMDYIGSEQLAAPTLNTLSLDPQEARRLYERLLHNIELMLAQGIVHGDLSAYNVLYWEGKPTLIDFPQVISPHQNRNAYPIFERDMRRLCEYFITQGLSLDPQHLARDLWKAHGFRLRPEVHPSLLDGENPSDRRLWKAEQKSG